MIRSLLEVSDSCLYGAFNEAFKDYPVSWDMPAFERMLKRRGFSKDISYGYFDNGKLASFVMNGQGSWQGMKAAYDTGTGTIEKYRGKKLTEQILKTVIAMLKKNDFKIYVLEVLEGNDKAISIYTVAGFVVSRKFNYYVAPVPAIITTKKPGVEIKKTGWQVIKNEIDFLDFDPSWQNKTEAILRSLPSFEILGAFQNNELCGYGIIEVASGDIPCLAVSRRLRRTGIGTLLLHKLSEVNTAPVIKFINVPADCESMNMFIKSMGIAVSGAQLEMTLAL